MSDLIPVKRALISVSDKSGLAEFATALVKEFNVELISTGGTAKFLREMGLPVKDVSEVTGFPEMMDGRVKTLHPKIHGGLLSLRDNAEHVAAMKAHDITPIDLVCINLYPFAQTIAKPNVTFEEAIENIDIGGPSMIRSAAKNHRFVLVVTSPDRYEKVLGDMREHQGATCGKHRLKQAQRAFQHTADYDALIQKYLLKQVDPPGKSSTGGGPSRFRTVPHEGAIATLAPEADEIELGTTPVRSRLVERLSRRATLTDFMRDLITAQAMVVAGTEAIAFTVIPNDKDFVLQLIDHVRPDDASEEVRKAAISAFAEIARPCVLQNKDGAIRIEGTTTDALEPQFCLLTILRNESEVPAIVTAVICRCPNEDRAKQRLQLMELVAGYFDIYQLRQQTGRVTSSDRLIIDLEKKQDLRYGENPHQTAALYVSERPGEATVARATQHHGKELSYINLLDADAALSAVKEFRTPAACIVKHATPCGCATAEHLSTAFLRAYEGDPLAAFGGIVALNDVVDLTVAQAITAIDKLLEVIVAPSYSSEALDLLKNRWKNVRLLEVGPVLDNGQVRIDTNELFMHKIVGGMLVQHRDLSGLNEADWKVVSKRQPTKEELADLRTAWLICKHVKSNAIVLGKNQSAVGIGGGQVDRVNAARIAIQKAGDRAKGAVVASDAFFPFPDGPRLLLEAGVTAIIHPGGSVKDAETLAVVDAAAAVMILTGQRHFRH
jgi:AICAR transformylase/IMP cyclohydrolase PurH